MKISIRRSFACSTWIRQITDWTNIEGQWFSFIVLRWSILNSCHGRNGFQRTHTHTHPCTPCECDHAAIGRRGHNGWCGGWDECGRAGGWNGMNLPVTRPCIILPFLHFGPTVCSQCRFYQFNLRAVRDLRVLTFIFCVAKNKQIRLASQQRFSFSSICRLIFQSQRRKKKKINRRGKKS